MKEINSVAEARKWANELKNAKKEDLAWIKRSKKIVKRYRDDRASNYDSNKRYNVLWSNVQTLMPALYGKTPRAQVERRYKDQDPVGRTAAVIMERALQYEIDHYGDYENATRHATLDRLLPGRGTVWVRFEAKEVETVEIEGEGYSEEGKEKEDYGHDDVEGAIAETSLPTGIEQGEGYEQLETTPVDYVYWEDFRCSPARTWDEVWWCGRRVYMSKEELTGRFGEDAAKGCPMTHEPIGLDEMKTNGASQADMDALKKAQVWEIWCKNSKCVYWVAEGYDKLLDHKQDPYGLDNFWPCPKPLWSTQTTDTLIPISDYCLYQDQAEEIDELTKRIGLLVKAVKVVGVYDASQPSIQRMLTEGVDNTLLPVDSWAAFSEKGGIKGTVDFMPLDMVIQALNQCYSAREQAKQVVYDVTGLSDIIRGSSVASETATAQQIKGQYASMRLKNMQHAVAMFVSDTLRIKAQLMADLYSPQTLMNMSGIMGTKDAQYAERAIQLLKSEPTRNFRIEVAADSLAEMDEMAEKASRTEFLMAFGSAMRDSLPIIQQSPEMGPLLGEALMFVVRSFKSGRALENTLESAIDQMKQPKQPQGPSPEQMQAQAQQQMEQAKMQQAQQTEQMKMQGEQVKMQAAQQLEQAKMQASAELEQFKAQQAIQLEQMRQEAETQRQAYKAELDSQTKLQIAQMQTEAASKPVNQFTVDSGGKFDEIATTLTESASQQGAGIADAVNTLAQVSAALVGAVDEMKRPKRRVLERDPITGKAVGAIEISE
jgi:hypothetical protein